MKTKPYNPKAILIFLFYVQFLINFIDEYQLMQHPFFKQKLKNLLKGFADALLEQMNRFVLGDMIKPVTIGDEALDATHHGLLELEEYFRVAFQLAELSEDKQAAFEADYHELIKKHQLTKSLEEVTVNK
jgi:hypothetical protein